MIDVYRGENDHWPRWPDDARVFTMSTEDFDSWPKDGPRLTGERRMRKLAVLEKVAYESRPEELIVWIDADTSVWAPIVPHLKERRINAVRHAGPWAGGRHDCGDGVRLPHEEYLIGCFWAMPAVQVLELCQLAIDRESWALQNRGGLTVDQNLLNILAFRRPDMLHVLNPPGTPWAWGLEWGIARPEEALPGSIRFDPRCDRLVAGGRRVALLNMTSPALAWHRADGWSGIADGEARSRLRNLYQVEERESVRP